MSVDTLVEASETTVTVVTLLAEELVIEIRVGQSETSGIASGDAVIEVLSPSHPTLNTYGTPIVFPADGAIPEFACLVILTGAELVTLPNPGALGDGRFIDVKNAGATTADLDPNSITIDGNSAPVPLAAGESIRLVAYDGAWLIL